MKKKKEVLIILAAIALPYSPGVRAQSLSEFHGGCNDISKSRSPDCVAAMHRYCSQSSPERAGVSQEVGQGVFGVACLNLTWYGVVPLADLTAQHPGCVDGYNSQNAYCMSAVRRWCLQTGHGKAGITQELGNGVFGVACFDPQTYQDVAVTTLKNEHGGCDDLGKSQSPECVAAMHRWCSKSGHGTAGLAQEVGTGVFGVACFNASVGDVRVNPPVASPGAARGRYRVVINGFSVTAPTWDHSLQVDGKGDEVYIAWQAITMDKNGDKLGDFRDSTRTMGDINGHANREMAGSLSSKGGLKEGDTYPAGGAPWIQDASLVRLDRNVPPLKVWEGELVKGETSVVLTPSIWEWDGGKDAFEGWVNWASTMFEQVKPKAQAIASGDATTGYIIQGIDIGLTIAVTMKDAGVFGQASDRPIGMKKSASNPKLFEFPPQALALNYDRAEYLINNELIGRGPGVVSLQFEDHPDLKGRYVLYLQVQRVQP